MNIRTTTSIFLALIPLFLCGQSLERAVISSAGKGSTNNGELSHTYGQIWTQTSTELNMQLLTQGFEQPDSTDFVSSVDQKIGLSLTLYPSPVMDKAKLKISSKNPGRFDLLLYDVSGALVSRPHSALPVRAGTTQEWTLDLEGISSGMYLLMVRDADRGISQSIKFKKVR